MESQINSAALDFFNLISETNPFLASDRRVNVFMTNKLLGLMEEGVETGALHIDFIDFMDNLCVEMRLPQFIVEAFLEMFISAKGLQDRFVHYCRICRENHSIAQEECDRHDSMIIKTASGVIVAESVEDLLAVKA